MFNLKERSWGLVDLLRYLFHSIFKCAFTFYLIGDHCEYALIKFGYGFYLSTIPFIDLFVDLPP